MKKILLLVLVSLTFQTIRSQEIYFNTGKNYTNYSFNDSSKNNSNFKLQSGNGNFYEIGYTMPINYSTLNYSVGLCLNEFNAVGNSLTNSYAWDTDYLGLTNAVNFTFFNNDNFDISVKGGFGVSTIIYGKQKINDTYLDLISQKEFSGIFVQPLIGLQTKYNISNDNYLSFGYNFSKSINLFNKTDEHLSFNNHQLQFGIHFITN